jgi:hypothetical protein
MTDMFSSEFAGVEAFAVTAGVPIRARLTPASSEAHNSLRPIEVFIDTLLINNIL